MNITYLMTYISNHLHTFVRQYDFSKNSLQTICEQVDFNDSIMEHFPLEDYLFTFLSDKTPVIASIHHTIYYAVVTSVDCVFLIGPLRLTQPVSVNNKIPDFYYDQDFEKQLYCCDLKDVIADLLLLHNIRREKSITASDMMLATWSDEQTRLNVQKFFSELIFTNQEQGETHNPYDQEVREFSSIRTGNLEQLKKSMEEDYIGSIGTLAPTPLRHMKNLGIVLVTLASRAAMEGGVNPEIAYSLSDSYIQQIESMQDPEMAHQLGKQAEFQYAQMVHDLTSFGKTSSTGENYVVTQCKNYIFNHLHDKISVAQMANEFHLNTSYLSDTFCKKEGVSLTDYIRREKINRAQNMLIYSNFSYSEIATYLGFCSQSHFGTQFKRNTELTPKQYREKYGVRTFTN